MKNKIENAVAKLATEIDKIKNKNFYFYFYVLDTKGNPSGSLSYIYENAYNLKKLGYKVAMLHNEEEFIGVESWMGKEYAELPHFNVEKENVEISASDFLFIPELLTNIMIQTKNLPCKKIAILQNFNYLTEGVPMGTTWDSLKVRDVIVNTEQMEEKVKEIFPNVRTHVIPPCISKEFEKKQTPKELVVNIVAKNTTDINAIVKPLQWKYPLFRFITFRDVRGLPKSEVAKAFQNSPITVWIDRDTNFGYTPLEAMKCGSIVIGKIPDEIPQWMLDNNDKLKTCGLWFDNMRSMHKLLAQAINSWIHDVIPNELYEEMEKTSEIYSIDNQVKTIESFYKALVEEREKEIEIILKEINNKKEK